MTKADFPSNRLLPDTLLIITPAGMEWTMNSCWSLMKMAFCSDTTWFQSGLHKKRGGNAPISTSVSCLLAACLFSGCIPVVTPALLSPDSRADLTAASQRGIEVGKTTRVDVLLALGEPDGRAVDERWFTYSSVRASSAGWLDIGGGLDFGKKTVNRLVVQ